jgi:hypothetical protein
MHLGQFATATALCRELIDQPDISPINRMMPLASCGLIVARQGEVRAAQGALDEALDSALGTGEAATSARRHCPAACAL